MKLCSNLLPFLLQNFSMSFIIANKSQFVINIITANIDMAPIRYSFISWISIHKYFHA